MNDFVWVPRFYYRSKDPSNPVITSISVSRTGNSVCAGDVRGHIHIFERMVDGDWIETSNWVGNEEFIDLRLRKNISAMIVDTDLFPIQRRSNLLLTSGQRSVRVWSISDRCEPLPPAKFMVGDKLVFPPLAHRERYIVNNEIALIQPKDNLYFGSVRASTDNLTFAYTEGPHATIQRLDKLDSRLIVYSNDSDLTRLDFHPMQPDIILVGDENGVCSFVDLRTAPHQTSATSRFYSKGLLDGRFSYVSDCRFSQDGSLFYSRHYSDIFFWDIRNSSAPLKQVKFNHDGDRPTKQMSTDGRDFFRSCWCNGYVATGSFGGNLFLVDPQGNCVQRSTCEYTNSRQPRFLFGDRKTKWMQNHQICSIDVAPNGTRAAVSNGSMLVIYDITKR